MKFGLKKLEVTKVQDVAFGYKHRNMGEMASTSLAKGKAQEFIIFRIA